MYVNIVTLVSLKELSFTELLFTHGIFNYNNFFSQLCLIDQILQFDLVHNSQCYEYDSRFIHIQM